MSHLAYEYLASSSPKSSTTCPPLAGIAGASGASLSGATGSLAAVPALADHIPFDNAALVAAACLNGRLPWSPSPPAEAAWRISSLFAAAENVGGLLMPTAFLDSLESQEKRSLSYSLGMTLAVYAGWAAGLRFPLHFSLYVASHGGPGRAYIANPPPRVGVGLPDLAWVNMPLNQCHIWECKGSALRGGWTTPCSDALAAALDQSLRITRFHVPSIGLAPPSAHISSVVRRDGPRGDWHLHVSDPEGAEGRPSRSDNLYEIALFYGNFYRPIIRIIEMVGGAVDRERRSVNNIDFIISDPFAPGVRIGLDARIFNALNQMFEFLFDFPTYLEPGYYEPGSWAYEVLGTLNAGALRDIEESISNGYSQPDSGEAFISPEGVLFERLIAGS